MIKEFCIILTNEDGLACKAKFENNQLNFTGHVSLIPRELKLISEITAKMLEFNRGEVDRTPKDSK